MILERDTLQIYGIVHMSCLRSQEKVRSSLQDALDRGEQRRTADQAIDIRYCPHVMFTIAGESKMLLIADNS